MTYSVKRFEFPSSNLGKGNTLADTVNIFLGLNLGITVVKVSVNWREGRSRGQNLYLNLLYRGGGTLARTYARQFQSTLTTQAETEADAFFAANPQFIPVQTVVLSRPDVVPRNRRLLVLYSSIQDAQAPCLRNAPVGVPGDPVAEGAYGLFWDDLDLNRQALPALNLGNGIWPDGGANLLFRSVDADPSMCAWAGIAPCCYAGPTFDAPAIIEPVLNCDPCLPQDLLTITFTATFPTDLTTTLPPSTTPPYPPEPTTTSTTTTAPSCPEIEPEVIPSVAMSELGLDGPFTADGATVVLGFPGCCYQVDLAGFLDCSGWECTNGPTQSIDGVLMVVSGDAFSGSCVGTPISEVNLGSIMPCPDGPSPVNGQLFICGEVTVRLRINASARCFPAESAVASLSATATLTNLGPCDAVTTTTTTAPPTLNCLFSYTSTWDCDISEWGAPVLVTTDCTNLGTYPDPIGSWYAPDAIGQPCVLQFNQASASTCSLPMECLPGAPPAAPVEPEPVDCCTTTTTTTTTPPPMASCGGIADCPGGAGVFNQGSFPAVYGFTGINGFDGYSELTVDAVTVPCHNFCINVDAGEESALLALSVPDRTIDVILRVVDCDGVVTVVDSTQVIYTGGTQQCWGVTFTAGYCLTPGAYFEVSIEPTAAFLAAIAPFSAGRVCTTSDITTDGSCGLPPVQCDICTAPCTGGFTVEDLPFFGTQFLDFVGLISHVGNTCQYLWQYVDGANQADLTIDVDRDTNTAVATLTVTDGVDTCEYTAAGADGLNLTCNLTATSQDWSVDSVVFQLVSGACVEVPFINS